MYSYTYVFIYICIYIHIYIYNGRTFLCVEPFKKKWLIWKETYGQHSEVHSDYYVEAPVLRKWILNTNWRPEFRFVFNDHFQRTRNLNLSSFRFPICIQWIVFINTMTSAFADAGQSRICIYKYNEIWTQSKILSPKVLRNATSTSTLLRLMQWIQGVQIGNLNAQSSDFFSNEPFEKRPVMSILISIPITFWSPLSSHVLGIFWNSSREKKTKRIRAVQPVQMWQNKR